MRLTKVVKGTILSKIQTKKIAKLDQNDLVWKQVQLFRAIGLDWLSANQKVVELSGVTVDGGSQHYELFVALGEIIKPRRILEIGTSEAVFTAFLSKAFPDATIETIDLPIEDERFWNAIDGGQEVSAVNKQLNEAKLRSRNENLKKSRNVNFREINSLALCQIDEEQFDLIWVDGDHTFPIVACDVANAVRLLKPSGTLVCDDVFLGDTKSKNDGWGSHEIKKTLNAFTKANILSVDMVLKRLTPHKNFDSKVQKHIAVCRLL